MWFQKEGENELVVLEIRMMVGFEEMGGAEGGFWVLVMMHFWFLVTQVRSHLKFYYRALTISNYFCIYVRLQSQATL